MNSRLSYPEDVVRVDLAPIGDMLGRPADSPALVTGNIDPPSAEGVRWNPEVEDEVSQLTWKVIDGKASPAELDRLEQLVTGVHEARRNFLDAVNLDCELRQYFAAG